MWPLISFNLLVHHSVYDDVEDCFKKWKAAGKTLCIYSSGSVAAQQLLFSYSEAGDLTQVTIWYRLLLWSILDTDMRIEKCHKHFSVILSFCVCGSCALTQHEGITQTLLKAEQKVEEKNLIKMVRSISQWTPSSLQQNCCIAGQLLEPWCSMGYAMHSDSRWIPILMSGWNGLLSHIISLRFQFKILCSRRLACDTMCYVCLL